MLKTVFGVLFTAVAVCAQTSQINGTVRDATGSVMPGAAIKATQTATGAVRTATSGTDGGYAIPNLPTGPYLVEVTKEGFSRFVQTGIALEVDGRLFQVPNDCKKIAYSEFRKALAPHK